MSLADVERKVMASAEKEARELLAKAEAEARAEFERRSAALRDEQRRRSAIAQAEAEASAERQVNARKAEYSLRLLEGKNEIFSDLFRAVADRALGGQGFDYGRWLAAQVRQACAEAPSGTFHCTERDRPAVEALVREARANGIRVASQPGLMRGGVYLVGDGTDLDLTLDAALEDLRDELAVSLAERLFGDVPSLGEAAEHSGA